MTPTPPAAGDVLPITGVDVASYTIPTSTPQEQDGTLTWDSTTTVVVEVTAGGVTGMGWTYGPTAVATLIRDKLAGVLEGQNALDVRARWQDAFGQLRNAGRPGIGAHALSALDIALWDGKARALGLSLVDLWGAARPQAPIYGSGGFTNHAVDQVAEQLSGWVDQGIPRVKMKVGREPDRDPDRVAAVRDAIGPEPELMVDANGAYTVQQALEQSDVFASLGVRWHEEPVSSDDLRGLRHVRESVAPGVTVAAGEYGYDVFHFRNLIEAGAVDCVQADVTRCGGFTGFLDAAALAFAHTIDLSAHCVPNLSAHVCCAAPRIRHVEYFHDHVRIEHLLFDGVLVPRDGGLRPDRSRPGHGLELKRADAEQWAD